MAKTREFRTIRKPYIDTRVTLTIPAANDAYEQKVSYNGIEVPAEGYTTDSISIKVEPGTTVTL